MTDTKANLDLFNALTPGSQSKTEVEVSRWV
jgi:hypothetical protein